MWGAQVPEGRGPDSACGSRRPAPAARKFEVLRLEECLGDGYQGARLRVSIGGRVGLTGGSNLKKSTRAAEKRPGENKPPGKNASKSLPRAAKAKVSTNYSNKVVVFYAWQTDSPGRTNRHAIRSALRTAFSKLEEEFSDSGLELTLDEATRGRPGSPNIPQTILQKIEQSSIFVCDLTTIVEENAPWPAVQNPNVVFELGHAVAHLGWDRVIMLGNQVFGKFPEDLPFDIDRQRASPYEIRDDSNASKASIRAPLESLLIDALKTIIVEDPKKPSEAKKLTVDELRRRRDLDTLRRLLEAIHWPTIDRHLSGAPYIIEDRVFFFWEGLDSILSDSLFHLYDRTLAAKLQKFYQLWGKTLSFGNFYRQAPHSDRYIFATEMDLFTSREQEEAWKVLNKTIKSLRKAKDDLLADIRDKYPELELSELTGAAWTQYVNFKREMAKEFEVVGLTRPGTGETARPATDIRRRVSRKRVGKDSVGLPAKVSDSKITQRKT
jgi:hypothetical protein